MAFKTKKHESINFDTPQEMFQDNRRKKTMGIFDYQSQMLDNYMTTIDSTGRILKRSVALELPTGSGKTLIGLLISEFHRRKYGRKTLYLCPTNQLVRQTVAQANAKFGLNAIAFCGRQSEYAPSDKAAYNLKNAIGVTTYSSFFASGSFFCDPQIIIFDDVHSSEEYIISNWSLNIDRNTYPNFYHQLTEFFKDSISDANYSRMSSDSPFYSDIMNWCDVVPRVHLEPKLSQLQALISENVSTTDLKYSWASIVDKLSCCNIFISWNNILIRPFIPPTLTHGAFSHTQQRIYMSATLGESGELERLTGTNDIYRLPIVSDWDTKGLGRRYFIFPDLSLDNSYHNELKCRLHDCTKRSVLIVPTMVEEQQARQLITANFNNIDIFSANDLSTQKEEFLNSKNGMVIMANRFDGIDFPDNESRLLIIDNLPKVTNIQERFFVSKLGASVLFSERIKTRIVQATGRCTRNASDYSAVCMLGNSIINDLTSNEQMMQYHPELRAEIDFGINNSTDFKTVDDVIENLNLFLTQGDDWEEANSEIIITRDEYIQDTASSNMKQIYSKLQESANLEVSFIYDMWKNDVGAALEKVINIIDTLNAPSLGGYKCFWQYIGGCLAESLATIADASYTGLRKRMFEDALKANFGLLWLPELLHTMESGCLREDANDNLFINVIERLENELLRIKTGHKFERNAKEILNGLASDDGTVFEAAHHKLGIVLGYHAIKSSEDSSPDTCWIVNDNLCIVAEDKIYDSNESKIPSKHVRQATSHETWVRKNISTLNTGAEIITIFATNSEDIFDDAKIFADDIYYLNRKLLLEWAHKAIGTLRTIRVDCTNEGNTEWRMRAIKAMTDNEVGPKDYLQLIKSQKKLSELPLS